MPAGSIIEEINVRFTNHKSTDCSKKTTRQIKASAHMAAAIKTVEFEDTDDRSDAKGPGGQECEHGACINGDGDARLFPFDTGTAGSVGGAIPGNDDAGTKGNAVVSADAGSSTGDAEDGRRPDADDSLLIEEDDDGLLPNDEHEVVAAAEFL